MAMSPAKIKYELGERGWTLAMVARDLDLSASHVSAVIRRKTDSARVRQFVAGILGESADVVFGTEPTGVAA